jgi:Na+-transporting NADH:ubiquinone oxidoreductase subunit NqrC
MQKELTISLDEELYERLARAVGEANISQFIESVVRPRLVDVESQDSVKNDKQAEHRFKLKLLEEWLLSALPRGVKNSETEFVPIHIEGEEVSQLIIRERR